MLKSPNIRLIPFSPTDWEYLANWFYNDTCKEMFRHFTKCLTKEDFEKYPQILGGIVFMIAAKDKIIGFVQAIPDFKTNRAAFVGLVIDKQYRGKRLSNEIMLLFFDYLFNKLGYRKIVLEIMEKNDSLKKTLQETGFLLEGKLIGDSFFEGEFVNELRFVMFSHYFNKKYQQLVKSWQD